MTIYKLEYEMQNGHSDTVESVNDKEIEAEFEKLKNDGECIFAQIKELFLYGGICQGENVIDEFSRE